MFVYRAWSNNPKTDVIFGVVDTTNIKIAQDMAMTDANYLVEENNSIQELLDEEIAELVDIGFPEHVATDSVVDKYSRYGCFELREEYVFSVPDVHEQIEDDFDFFVAKYCYPW